MKVVLGLDVNNTIKETNTMSKQYKPTAQVDFWKGGFGNDYIGRNNSTEEQIK